MIWLIRCFFCPAAWTMGGAGGGEASGLGFDHRLEGIAAQCPLLLQVEADLGRTGPGVVNPMLLSLRR